MRTSHRVAAGLAALLLLLPGQALAREARLIGKVVDPDGKPIPGVRVTTTSPEVAGFEKVTTTDSRGNFLVDFDTINVVYVYELDKPGYQTSKVEQKWGIRGTARQEFKLTPAEGPTLPGAAPVPPASLSPPAIEAYNAGVKAFEAKQHDVALAKFQEALGHDPELRLAWVALSAIHLTQKRYQQAAEAAEKAIALGANDESLLKTRWDAYRYLGDEAKAAQARADLEKLGDLKEEAKRVYNEGVAVTRVGDHKEAFAKYQEALKLDPNFEPALIGLATTALQLDRPGEAWAAAENLLRASPQHAEAIRIRYNAALKLGEEDKVVSALLGLAAIDATAARDALFQLADMAFQRDDVAKAKQRFQQVLRIDPAHPRAHYQLGLIMMREGAKAEARKHLQRFLELAPQDPDAATARAALEHVK